MIVLDTNVVSEIIRSKPEPRVLLWLKSCLLSDLFISVLTLTEMRFGAALLPESMEKQILNRRIDEVLRSTFENRVLAFDTSAAEICAKLMASKKAHTPLLKVVDLQIAATAISNNFAVATRDLNDFKHKGLNIINPWTD
jgi:toxin FitB